jgi:hypothetical protein
MLTRNEEGRRCGAAQNYQHQQHRTSSFARRQRQWRETRILKGKLTVLVPLLHDRRNTPAERITILQVIGQILLDRVAEGAGR